jgi:hypothetical protein
MRELERRAEALAVSLNAQNVGNTPWAYGKFHVAVPDALFGLLVQGLVDGKGSVFDIPSLLRAVSDIGREFPSSTLQMFVGTLSTGAVEDPFDILCAAVG